MLPLTIPRMKRRLQKIKSVISTKPVASLKGAGISNDCVLQQSLLNLKLISKKGMNDPFKWIGGVVSDETSSKFIEEVRRIRAEYASHTTPLKGKIPGTVKVVDPSQIPTAHHKPSMMLQQAKANAQEALLALAWAVIAADVDPENA